VVSIGIPFFNARATLADAVRSVFAQSREDWELLLVDDGSTDGSGDVARRVRDPRVRLMADDVNKGLPSRLNEIARLAQGEYLARMDADDLMHPQRLERQVRFLEAHPAVDVVDAAVYTIASDNEPLGKRGRVPLAADPVSVLRRGLLLHPAVTGRTAWFRNNPYDAGYVRAEDRELWIRTCARTVFARVPEPLLFYREDLSGNLKSYLQTLRSTRQILRTYGPPLVGRLGTARLVAGEHLKGLCYRLFTRLGRADRLIRRRNRPLEAAEAAAARAVIGRVLRTSVPGFEGCADAARADDRHEKVATRT